MEYFEGKFMKEVKYLDKASLSNIRNILNNCGLLPVDEIEIKVNTDIDCSVLIFKKNIDTVKIPYFGTIDIEPVTNQLYKTFGVTELSLQAKIDIFHETRSIPLACEIADDLYKLYN